MRNKKALILFIVLVVVIGLEVFLFVRFRDRLDLGAIGGSAAAPAAAITQSPEMTAPPVPTLAPATDTPEPTPTPTAAPTATPAPTPTAAPTVPPTATPVPSNSGTIESDTGTVLNMIVDWETEALGDGNTRIHLTGKISSYSLAIQGSSVTITLGDHSTTCQSPSFNISQDTETVSDLFSTTLDVPTGTQGTLKVDWNYRGTYSGVELAHIIAEGEVSA